MFKPAYEAVKSMERFEFEGIQSIDWNQATTQNTGSSMIIYRPRGITQGASMVWLLSRERNAAESDRLVSQSALTGVMGHASCGPLQTSLPKCIQSPSYIIPWPLGPQPR